MVDERHKILNRLLKNSAFDGWNNKTLEKSASECAIAAEKSYIYFPAGISDAVDYFSSLQIDSLKREIGRYNLSEKKLSERIVRGVLEYFNLNRPHREAIRKLIIYYSFPLNFYQGIKNLYKLVDAIWHIADDKSHDFSYYTKRITLSGILSATILYWLQDDSKDMSKTEEFLKRRISEMAIIPKAKAKFSKLNPAKKHN